MFATGSAEEQAEAIFHMKDLAASRSGPAVGLDIGEADLEEVTRLTAERVAHMAGRIAERADQIRVASQSR